MSQPSTRGEKRRFERAKKKALNPPKYGPVTIFTETFEKVEGQDSVSFKKSYYARTNIIKSGVVKK